MFHVKLQLSDHTLLAVIDSNGFHDQPEGTEQGQSSGAVRWREATGFELPSPEVVDQVRLRVSAAAAASSSPTTTGKGKSHADQSADSDNSDPPDPSDMADPGANAGSGRGASSLGVSIPRRTPPGSTVDIPDTPPPTPPAAETSAGPAGMGFDAFSPGSGSGGVNPLSPHSAHSAGSSTSGTAFPAAGSHGARKRAASSGTPLGLVRIETLAPPRNVSKKRLKKIQFVSGNPAIELEQGALHIFKDAEEPLGFGEAETEPEFPPDRHPVLVVLAVPTTTTPAELIKFCGPYRKHISHVRVLRDAAPNRYMAVLEFRAQDSCDDFYKENNNRAFNSLEPELVHLGFVASMEVVTREAMEAPFVGTGTADDDGVPAQIELPSCPVCLERMDASVMGVITILCQHSFHSDCLAKWGDNSCPVCRYCQRPPEASNICFSCDAGDALWICLICGNVGCGRYESSHAYDHYKEKGHNFAMELATQRVWDYQRDSYVHRLIQSKTDGKLVELPEPRGGRFDDEVDVLKSESLVMEFDQLLRIQLDSQRAFFEDELRKLSEDRDERVTEIETRLFAAEEALQKSIKLRKSAEKRADQSRARNAKLEEEVEFLRDLNASLVDDKSGWERLVAEANARTAAVEAEMRAEVAGLQDQIKDLMFFLDTREQLENSPDKADIQSGSIIIEAPPAEEGGNEPRSPHTPRTTGRKKRKKKRR